MKLQQQLGAQVLEKVVRGALLASTLTSAKSSRPLTSLAIGEELVDDDDEGRPSEAQEPVIKPVKRSER